MLELTYLRFNHNVDTFSRYLQFRLVGRIAKLEPVDELPMRFMQARGRCSLGGGVPRRGQSGSRYFQGSFASDMFLGTSFSQLHCIRQLGSGPLGFFALLSRFTLKSFESLSLLDLRTSLERA